MTFSCSSSSSWEKQSLGVAPGSLPRSFGNHLSISCSHRSSFSDSRLAKRTSVTQGGADVAFFDILDSKKKKKKKSPVEVVGLRQMFGESHFAREVLVHDDVVLLLHPDFVVPGGGLE